MIEPEHLFVLPAGRERQAESEVPQALPSGPEGGAVQLQEVLHQSVPRDLCVADHLLHPVRSLPPDHGAGRGGALRLPVLRRGDRLLPHHHRQPAGQYHRLKPGLRFCVQRVVEDQLGDMMQR